MIMGKMEEKHPKYLDGDTLVEGATPKM